MRDVLITKHIPGQQPIRFLVSVPEFGERNFYTETTSLNALMTREAKRAWGDNPPKAGTIVYLSVASETPKDVPNVRRVTGLFNFYRIVGYDYKRQRFLSPAVILGVKHANSMGQPASKRRSSTSARH